MSSFGIARIINYKVSSPQQAKRVSGYIQQLTRTDSRYIISNYITEGNVKRGIEIIEKRWNPRGTRSFKQGIISFGKSINEFSPESAVCLMADVLQFFSKYPWLAAIHTNKPERLHSHFILVTTNVHTGKKLSQSSSDLRKFKLHYNSVCERYGLPLIPISGTAIYAASKEGEKKHQILPSEHQFSIVNESRPDYDHYKVPVLYFDRNEEDIVPYFETTPSSTNNDEPLINMEQALLQTVMECYREDYKAFFTLGFQIGGEYNV